MSSRRRFLGSLAGGLGLTALSGCGYRSGGGDIRWQTETPRGLSRASAAEVTDGLLVAVADSTKFYDAETDEFSRGGRIRAYGADDGAGRWREHLHARLSCHAIGGGGAAVGFKDKVVSLREGGEQWRAYTGTSPVELAVADGHVYVLTEDQSLLACADGSVRWRRELSASTSEHRAVDVAAGPELVVARLGGAITAFAPGGSSRWTRSNVTNGLEVAVVDGDVFVGPSFRPVVLDADSGETRWVGERGTGRVAVTDDAVYQTAAGTLVAFDRSGERRWSAGGKAPSGRTDRRSGTDDLEFEGRIAADGEGIFAETDGGVAALDPADGRVRWRVSYDEPIDDLYAQKSGVLVVTEHDFTSHYRETTLQSTEGR